jgi:uncharacterized protein YukE
VVALTPADVKRWDPDAIHAVFQTASDRAATLQRLGDNLAQVHNTLSDWHGDAGDAFRADLGKTRRDIDADGHESKQVAAAVSLAEADVRAVKSELDGIEQAAEGYGFSITPDWRIDPGVGAIGLDKLTLAAEEQLLQGQLDTCKLHAQTADQELANAVRGAVGDAPISAGAPAPAGKPKSWQEMLLPAGPASGQPGGDPAKGPPVPDADGMPPSLDDMLLGRGRPADPQPADLVSGLKPPVVPPQRLDPAAIESFKAMARQSMIAEGVPPDQIEARLNAAVANTQRWMDAGMPKYVAPPPPKPPAPGFGDGFGDRWNATITGIQDLVGANGGDAMGDAWAGMAKGLAGKAEEYLTLGPVAPIADGIGEVKSFMDNPSYYLGGKTADGALSAPAMMFGPEGAGIGELGEASAAGAIARDLPGVHPSVGVPEQLLPDLHPPLSPLEAPHEGFHPSGPIDEPLTGFIDTQGPPDGPLSAGVHPSGPVDGPAPGGSGGHPWSEPAEVVAPVGHPPPDPPGGPMHSEAPAVAGHAAAPGDAPLGAGHDPDSAKVPVAAGHVSNPAEAHAPASHVPAGPPEPPLSGGHGGSGPLDAPAGGGHGGSGPPEPPAGGGHGGSGPSEPPTSGGHPSDGLPNHAPIEANPPYVPPPESQWAPIGHDQPITYHPEASQVALDLNEAFAHHQPTVELSQRLADMSTHYVGDNPDRVVLGKWNGNESGYIGEARGHGGIYYDTSTEVWDNVGQWLSKAEANHLGWEVNENFLRSQMERGVDRIDYVVKGTEFTSVEDVLENDTRSFSAKEIRFLIDNASSYGYKRIGDSWVRVKGGQP